MYLRDPLTSNVSKVLQVVKSELRRSYPQRDWGRPQATRSRNEDTTREMGSQAPVHRVNDLTGHPWKIWHVSCRPYRSASMCDLCSRVRSCTRTVLRWYDHDDTIHWSSRQIITCRIFSFLNPPKRKNVATKLQFMCAHQPIPQQGQKGDIVRYQYFDDPSQ